MSVFICSKCNCIENTNLVNPDYLETAVTYTGDVEHFHPNMGGSDMRGYSESNILVNSVLWKKSTDVMMLCSECNTGKWHGEFDKTLATEEEIEFSKYSKYNMITPLDQEHKVVGNANNDIGYELDPKYAKLHTLYRQIFNKKHSDHIMHTAHLNYFWLLYAVYVENPDNFELYHNTEDTDWYSLFEVSLIVLDSLVDENTKSPVVNKIRKIMYKNSNNLGSVLSEIKDSIYNYELGRSLEQAKREEKTPTIVNKLTTIDDKLRIEKALVKRQQKQLRKKRTELNMLLKAHNKNLLANETIVNPTVIQLEYSEMLISVISTLLTDIADIDVKLNNVCKDDLNIIKKGTK